MYELNISMSLVWINVIISVVMIILRKINFGNKYEEHQASIHASGLIAVVVYIAALININENFGIDNIIRIDNTIGIIVIMLRVVILFEESIIRTFKIRSSNLATILEFGVLGCGGIIFATALTTLLIDGYFTRYTPDIINFMNNNRK